MDVGDVGAGSLGEASLGSGSLGGEDGVCETMSPMSMVSRAPALMPPPRPSLASRLCMAARAVPGRSLEPRGRSLRIKEGNFSIVGGVDFSNQNLNFYRGHVDPRIENFFFQILIHVSTCPPIQNLV